MGPLKACVHENLLEIAIDTEGLVEKVCADCGERFSVTDEEKKEWGEEQVKLRRCILYTIQPTDSVAGIAKRFGVDLRRLVELNPQVCTPGPQAGIEIMIPVGHLEIVPDVLQEIESEDPGVQEERVAGFKLKLPNGELYQFEEMVSVE